MNVKYRLKDNKEGAQRIRPAVLTAFYQGEKKELVGTANLTVFLDPAADGDYGMTPLRQFPYVAKGDGVGEWRD